MKTSELFILAGGVLTLFMVIFHCLFYKMFDWRSEFEKIKLINHRIFISIHVALILSFTAAASLSFLYYREMADCNGIACGLVVSCAVFWLWRTMWQIFYFKIPKDVKKTPVLHYLLIVIFALLFISYTIPVIIKLTN